MTNQGVLAAMYLLSQTLAFSGIVDSSIEALLIHEVFVLMQTQCN